MAEHITESNPLKWPDGWQRTRIQDREPRSSWKGTLAKYKDDLGKELKRMGATDWLITFNRGIGDNSSNDPGVAVYFSRQPVNQYEWQEALGFIGIVPTKEQIEESYRRRIRAIHPYGPTPDEALFRSVTDHRNRALAWARGEEKREHEYVIACDKFKETRLNMKAAQVAVYSIWNRD